MKIWIVVADQREALFYDAGADGERRDRASSDGVSAGEGARLVLKMSYPDARPDSELRAERPGREFRGSTERRRRSDGEGISRRSDHEHFAARIGEEIDRAGRAGRFDRLVLSASPSMLELIRSKLSAQSRALLAAEVNEGLPRSFEHSPFEDLEQVIPELSSPPERRAGEHR